MYKLLFELDKRIESRLYFKNIYKVLINRNNVVSLIKKKKMLSTNLKDYMTAFKEMSCQKILSVIKEKFKLKRTPVENLSDEEVIKILNKTAKSLK
jgi:hypothetical protein